MPINILFWVLMVLWFVFGIWAGWPFTLATGGFHAVAFLTVGVLGWKVFGPVLQAQTS